MRTFNPAPAGLEAPDVLPPAPAAVSAEASGLGGSDSVTLIATSVAEPVNSPAVAKAAGSPSSPGTSSDLGTFTTTAAGSAASARAHVVTQAALLIAGCSGRTSSIVLSGRPAVACSSGQGPIITFTSGNWTVQAQDFDGPGLPQAAADAVASWLGPHKLPAASKGLVSLTVPGNSQAGTVATSQVVWSHGSDDYAVSGRGSYVAALTLAASMRRWSPG